MAKVKDYQRRGREVEVVFDYDGQEVTGFASAYKDTYEEIIEEAWRRAKNKVKNRREPIDLNGAIGMQVPDSRPDRITIHGKREVEDLEKLNADDYSATVYDQYGDKIQDADVDIKIEDNEVIAEYEDLKREITVKEKEEETEDDED